MVPASFFNYSALQQTLTCHFNPFLKQSALWFVLLKWFESKMASWYFLWTGRLSDASVCYEHAIQSQPEELAFRHGVLRNQLALGELNSALSLANGMISDWYVTLMIPLWIGRIVESCNTSSQIQSAALHHNFLSGWWSEKFEKFPEHHRHK